VAVQLRLHVLQPEPRSGEYQTVQPSQQWQGPLEVRPVHKCGGPFTGLGDWLPGSVHRIRRQYRLSPLQHLLRIPPASIQQRPVASLTGDLLPVQQDIRIGPEEPVNGLIRISQQNHLISRTAQSVHGGPQQWAAVLSLVHQPQPDVVGFDPDGVSSDHFQSIHPEPDELHEQVREVDHTVQPLSLFKFIGYFISPFTVVHPCGPMASKILRHVRHVATPVALRRVRS